MYALNLRDQLANFEREREARRRSRRAGAPTLALVSTEAAPAPVAPYTPAQTAAEAEGVLTDYFRCDEEGRRDLARLAKEMAGGG